MRAITVLLCPFLLSCSSSSDGEHPQPVRSSSPAAPVAAPALTDLRTRKTGDDWPSFLGRHRNSKSTETGILTEWPRSGPTVVWNRQLGTSYGICSVSRGRLFQFDRYGDQARLTCLTSETGEPLWQFEYPTDYTDLYGYNHGPRCSPVVDEDRVYIFGAEGLLHCIRAVDGRLIWKVDTQKKYGVVQNFFGVGSTPLIAGDLLIVVVGGSPAESHDVPPGQLDRVVGNGTGIVAFDKCTGREQYRITDELAGYSSPIAATIDGRSWCFALLRGGLVGFDPASGKVAFHHPWRAKILESVNAAVPVIVGDRVLISETYGPGSALLQVRAAGYDIVWRDDPARRAKAMQAHWNTPVYHQGYLYGSSGRYTQNAELRCIEWQTGKVMWSEPGLTRSSLLYVDGHFVCLSEDGTLRLIKANPRRYEPVAATVLREPSEPSDPLALPDDRLLKYPAWAAPILAQGLLYVRGKDRLVCLELIPE